MHYLPFINFKSLFPRLQIKNLTILFFFFFNVSYFANSILGNWIAGLQASYPFLLSCSFSGTPAQYLDGACKTGRAKSLSPFSLKFLLAVPLNVYFNNPQGICTVKYKNHQSEFYTVIQLIISENSITGLNSFCALQS